MRYSLHEQPPDCRMDYRFSIFEDDKIIVLFDVHPPGGDERKRAQALVDLLNKGEKNGLV